jgi:hypothetical protein
MLAIASVAGVAWWRMRQRPTGDRGPAVTVEAAADSIGSLVARGRPLEAVPYVRQVEAQMPAPEPDFLGQFSSILSNATIELSEVHGLRIPATRSSVERVAMMREALLRLDQAEPIARSAEQRRDVVVTRARMLSVWGFQREAYVEYRSAHRFAPLDTRARSEAIWIERMTRDPTRAAPEPGRVP